MLWSVCIVVIRLLNGWSGCIANDWIVNVLLLLDRFLYWNNTGCSFGDWILGEFWCARCWYEWDDTGGRVNWNCLCQQIRGMAEGWHGCPCQLVCTVVAKMPMPGSQYGQPYSLTRLCWPVCYIFWFSWIFMVRNPWGFFGYLQQVLCDMWLFKLRKGTFELGKNSTKKKIGASKGFAYKGERTRTVRVGWWYTRMAEAVLPCYVSLSVPAGQGEGHMRMVLMHTRMGSNIVFCCVLGAVLPSLGNCEILVILTNNDELSH